VEKIKYQYRYRKRSNLLHFIRKSKFSWLHMVVLAVFVSLIGVAIFLISHALTPCANKNQGDINCDGKVNILDLSILLSNYSGTDPASDINGDGTVNISDLSILLSKFNTTVVVTPPPPILTAPLVFGKTGSFWRTRLPDNVAINATDTPGTQADLVKMASSGSKPYINTNAYTSEVYLVHPNTPLVPISLTKTGTFTNSLRAVMAYGFPIPPDFTTPNDSDQEFVAYCPDCVSPDGLLHGYEWEAFGIHQDTSGNWLASWGGRIAGVQESVGHFVVRYGPASNKNKYPYPTVPDPTTDPAAFFSYEDHTWGDMATSLPLGPSEITAADLKQGHIDHTIGLSIVDALKGYRWPAQRYDGGSTTLTVQEGMRLRLPPGFDCSALGMAQVGEEICNTVRDYGFVVDDRTLSNLDIRATPSAASLLGVAPSSVLNKFPWDQLEVLATGSDSNPNPTN
jgi:hypothetical protein